MNVYMLIHVFEGDEKRIGLFSSYEKAAALIPEYAVKPGFREAPDGFRIDEIEVGRVYWPDGF